MFLVQKELFMFHYGSVYMFDRFLLVEYCDPTVNFKGMERFAFLKNLPPRLFSLRSDEVANQKGDKMIVSFVSQYFKNITIRLCPRTLTVAYIRSSIHPPRPTEMFSYSIDYY